MHEAWKDAEREDGTLTAVNQHADGSWSVTSSNGWSCGIEARYSVTPKVGDEFVTWGSIGRLIRGQALNHEVLYYRTPAQQEAQNALERDARQAKRVAEYEGKRADFDARVLVLPEKLRERVEGFRVFGGDEWRWEFEPYEIFCCEEAVKLHAHFPTGESVKAFHALPHEAQRVAFPEMSNEHSGNTFGFSVRLAYLMAERPDLIAMEHGALCPLVGCKDYGCYSIRSSDIFSV